MKSVKKSPQTSAAPNVVVLCEGPNDFEFIQQSPRRVPIRGYGPKDKD